MPVQNEFDYRKLKTKEELISDPDKLVRDIAAYFKHCKDSREERELKNGDIRIREDTPSMLGLSHSIPTHMNTLNRLIDDDNAEVPQNKELIDAQNKVRDILAYTKQEIALRLQGRSMNGDANDRVSVAMMARMGLIGEDKANISLSITVAGADSKDIEDWSK